MKMKLTKIDRLAGFSYKSEVKLKGYRRELIVLLEEALRLVRAGIDEVMK